MTIDPDQLLIAAVMTDEGRQDPYSIYARLRAESPRWRSQAGSFVLTEYRDCLDVLRNPALGRPEPDMDLPDTFGQARRDRPERTSTMLLLNPPDHTRIRSLVSREFTPRRVEGLRPEIDAMVEPIVAGLVADGGGDVMERLAVPFPVAVISRLLGVPDQDHGEVGPLVRSLTTLIDPAADDEATAAGEAAAMELAAYFAALVERRRDHPDDALLSALIRVEESGDRLTFEELIANTILLYAAGFETTSNLIGNGLRLLLEDPERLATLRRRPELVPAAVSEMLRYDSPVQLNMRTTLREVELFGEVHQRGTVFVVLQGSGNHDETVYRDEATFDLERFTRADAATPLSFGWGAHHCLGAHLARAEGEAVFSALAGIDATISLDRSRLDGGEVHYRPSFTLRGLESLPVAIS